MRHERGRYMMRSCVGSSILFQSYLAVVGALVGILDIPASARMPIVWALCAFAAAWFIFVGIPALRLDIRDWKRRHDKKFWDQATGRQARRERRTRLIRFARWLVKRPWTDSKSVTINPRSRSVSVKVVYPRTLRYRIRSRCLNALVWLSNTRVGNYKPVQWCIRSLVGKHWA